MINQDREHPEKTEFNIMTGYQTLREGRLHARFVVIPDPWWLPWKRRGVVLLYLVVGFLGAVGITVAVSFLPQGVQILLGFVFGASWGVYLVAHYLDRHF